MFQICTAKRISKYSTNDYLGVYSPTASVGNRKKQKQKQQSVILNVFRKKAAASQRENQFISIARKRNKKTEVDADDVELLSPTSGV